MKSPWFLALALVGCGRIGFADLGDAGIGGDGSGSQTDPTDGSTSGARLKLQWYELADGSREFVDIFDSQRSEVCSPRAWSDGSSYCVPDFQTAVYADSSCTVPRVYRSSVDPCFPPPAYVRSQAPLECSFAGAHFYPMGVSTAETVYYSMFGGTCDQFAATAGTVYSVGPEVPISAFQELLVSDVSPNGQFTTRDYETTDGFNLQDVMHDAMVGVDCRLSTYDDMTICEPTAASVENTNVMSDAQCTTPIPTDFAGCGPPDYIDTWPGSRCGNDAPDWFSVGAADSVGAAYAFISGTCTSTSAPPGQTYATGPKLVLPDLTRSPDPSGRRLELIHDHGDGGMFRVPNLYDTAVGAECTTAPDSDGVSRCLPIGASAIVGFSDPGCSIPIAVVYAGSADCSFVPPAPYNYVELTTGNACAPPREIHGGSTAYTGTIFTGTPGSCSVEVTGNFYMLGPVVPPSQFLQATFITDP